MRRFLSSYPVIYQLAHWLHQLLLHNLRQQSKHLHSYCPQLKAKCATSSESSDMKWNAKIQNVYFLLYKKLQKMCICEFWWFIVKYSWVQNVDLLSLFTL